MSKRQDQLMEAVKIMAEQRHRSRDRVSGQHKSNDEKLGLMQQVVHQQLADERLSRGDWGKMIRTAPQALAPEEANGLRIHDLAAHLKGAKSPAKEALEALNRVSHAQVERESGIPAVLKPLATSDGSRDRHKLTAGDPTPWSVGPSGEGKEAAKAKRGAKPRKAGRRGMSLFRVD